MKRTINSSGSSKILKTPNGAVCRKMTEEVETMVEPVAATKNVVPKTDYSQFFQFCFKVIHYLITHNNIKMF